MKLHRAFLLAITVSGVLADAGGRTGHGLVGYGIQMFKPACAFACRDAISGATLKCSTAGAADMGGMAGMDAGMVMTDASCYATDDAFLQTLAWCVSIKCQSIPSWRLEKYWQDNVAGTAAVQPDPKESYQQALMRVNSTPDALYASTGPLNQTSRISDDLWYAAYNTDTIFEDQESMQEGYGLIILLSGVVIPISLSLLRFFPFPTAWRYFFNAWIIEPPLFGKHHDTPVLFGLVFMPKRGQAMFISYFIIINTVLSAVNYEYADPNTWYPGDKWRWMCMLVSNRLGLLSFANLPLVFLYAGRNNILLWITNWSHSTFILLHRWIAAIATLQAILHSIIYLDVYVKNGTHASESQKSFWYWGIIATVGLVIMFPTSVIPIRRKIYEAFLAWHVAIAVLVIAGCYWHIVFEFSHQWGYEVWIIMCMAVWGLDRVFRVARLAQYGVKEATITSIDSDYVRVTIPDVSAIGVAYLYFPTLTWRIWENHPFSVASSIIHPALQQAQNTCGFANDLEKHGGITTSATTTASPISSQPSDGPRAWHGQASTGITFYVRIQTGLTSALASRSLVPVLVESGYPSHSPLTESPLKSPVLVAVAGGVGITAVLPYLSMHTGRTKLFWGCRTQALVDDVERLNALSRVEKEVFVGERMSVRDCLDRELVGARTETCVLVSGPEGLIDEVRSVVLDISRKGTGSKVRLVVESFSW
ncbi:hypothetical protein CkaCkLH20_08628 [Colletotrichum karsti]|uniref:Ferric oxidoreductase domain-containing protein n=1 Tax=Colletotrichum karsti TaxID=1095194 RepID=A0A9P6I0M5_9PEZI|nr:uncharacterized protein CkaCkLH20_08628 [Colletotrichum karsti]KAF9873894.1 hypothetical protein CkaCkLH20_08628 [Colletotrichum karsti]